MTLNRLGLKLNGSLDVCCRWRRAQRRSRWLYGFGGLAREIRRQAFSFGFGLGSRPAVFFKKFLSRIILCCCLQFLYRLHAVRLLGLQSLGESVNSEIIICVYSTADEPDPAYNLVEAHL